MGEFADKLAAQSPAFQRAYLGSLAPNLVKSGNLEKYYQTLTDFDFIVTKINHPEFGVQSLIEDYDLLDDNNQIKLLQLIQQTLRLSAHILAEDKKQLASQLQGRLLGFEEIPEIQTFLEKVKQSQTYTCLHSLTPSLIPPGRRLVRTLVGHSDWVKAVAVTPNGKQVISGSKDNTLKVWNLETGEEQFTLIGHTESVNAIAVTPDGKRVISGSSDHTLKIWDLATGNELFTFSGHRTQVVALTVTPDSKWVISASVPNIIKVWDLESGKEKFTVFPHSDLIRSIVAYPDSKFFISGSDDKTIKVCDLKTGREHFSFNNIDKEPREGQFADEVYPDEVYAVAISPNSKLLIAGSSTNAVRVWNLETEKLLFVLLGHTAPIVAVAVTSDSKQLISASLDKTLKVWDLESGKELFTITGHNDSLYAAAVTLNGKWLISGSKDKTLKVWSLESLESEEDTSPNHYRNSVYASAISLDGKYAIFSLEGNTLKVWDLEDIKEISSINEQESKNIIVVVIRVLWLITNYLFFVTQAIFLAILITPFIPFVIVYELVSQKKHFPDKSEERENVIHLESDKSLYEDVLELFYISNISKKRTWFTSRKELQKIYRDEVKKIIFTRNIPSLSNNLKKIFLQENQRIIVINTEMLNVVIKLYIFRYGSV
ncbi:hypothetical protein, partial [Anabaena sp. CCY 9910]|uniref:hypothetical protein n=1 Tax=Anabaena sp. CCY 9910 TaxID=3103870 RepID=UPI0039E0AF91